MSFSILPGDATSPVVLHVPHSSRDVPAEVRAGIVLDDAGLAAELDAMTDAGTDVIATAVADRIAAVHGRRPWTMLNRCSRLVVDPERFPDPAREEMTEVGMGAVYTATSDRRPLRDPSESERQALIDTYFTPYADAMAELVDQRLAATGTALIVDVHSYPRDALPYERHADERRPAVCLGTDDVHTPATLVDRAHELFDDLACDEPFHGVYVPMRHYGHDTWVTAVMLELRRDTYLTEGGGVDPGWLDDFADRVARLVGPA